MTKREATPELTSTSTPLPSPMETTAATSTTTSLVSWHCLTIEEVIFVLHARKDLLEVGLTSDEAAQRLAQYGPNQLTEVERETLCQKIWKQISNVLVLILVIVAIVSAARAIVEQVAVPNPNSTTILTSWVQVALILTVITVNTIIGIMQEGSAEKATEALKNMLSAHARVLRDGGDEVLIPAAEIVPGDVVILSLGDRCPADIRIVQSRNLACQEAALTGEAIPIDKTVDAITVGGPESTPAAEQIPLGDRHNMAFSATLVSEGSGVGIVVATGDDTQIGTIHMLVNNVEKKRTNVLKQIDHVSKLLAVLIGLATLITFFIAMFVSKQDAFSAVSTALVCCVAMIPEGLEAIVTLTYAWAATFMARNNAILRTLPAVETLGSVTVICSDKTGTLTQNVMSLTALVTSDAHYEFNVNGHERTTSNFVRHDSFLAERARHLIRTSISQIFVRGAGSGEPRPGRKGSSFYFSIDADATIRKDKVDTTTETSEDDKGVEEEENGEDHDQDKTLESVCDETTPEKTVADGMPPNAGFLNSVLSIGVLCSKCVLGENGGRDGEIGNPTELSILRAAYFSGCDIDAMKHSLPIVAEVPFSSEYKFMATVHEDNDSNTVTCTNADNYVMFLKGAPDRMVQLCSFQARGGITSDNKHDPREPCDVNYWIDQIAILSSHGLRVLALCRATIPKSSITHGETLGPEFITEHCGRHGEPWLTMVALCAIMDPPRPECVQAIKEAKSAGVRVAMITGDHKDTAIAIGHMLGIIDEQYTTAVTGPELDGMSDEEIKDAVMTCNVFARAVPQNKIRIVKALQAQKQICSMTGDGVNDAPALKAADMGVAMGKEGTDVAREASEMILADDNFATIVIAIKEGRTVWDNLRKVLFINTIINNAQGMSVLFGLAFGLTQSPLSPIQVLYSNLICAITLGFVAAIEPAEEGIMNLPPRRIGKRLIGRYLLLRILIGTLTLTCLVVASAFWLRSFNDGRALFSLEDKNDPNNIMATMEATTDPTSSDKYGRILLQYYLEDVRAIAFNVLDFGAISITLSARFTYLPSLHPRVLRGNPYCWYSILAVTILQVMLTYIPVLNSVVFQMRGMDGVQWGIVIMFMVIVFFVMEAEKAMRRYLKFSRGADTDDREYGAFDRVEENGGGSWSEREDVGLLPMGASKLNLVSLER